MCLMKCPLMCLSLKSTAERTSWQAPPPTSPCSIMMTLQKPWQTETFLFPKAHLGPGRDQPSGSTSTCHPTDTSKAVCVHCMNEFSRGKNGKDLGTSCLIRHMWRAHRSIVLQENGGNTGIPPLYPMPPTLLPALLPPEGDLNSASLSPGKQVKESPSASSSPERLPEDLSSHTNPGDVSREDVSMLSSSDDLGGGLCSVFSREAASRHGKSKV